MINIKSVNSSRFTLLRLQWIVRYILYYHLQVMKVVILQGSDRSAHRAYVCYGSSWNWESCGQINEKCRNHRDKSVLLRRCSLFLRTVSLFTIYTVSLNSYLDYFIRFVTIKSLPTVISCDGFLMLGMCWQAWPVCNFYSEGITQQRARLCGVAFMFWRVSVNPTKIAHGNL